MRKKFRISQKEPVFIVAEISANHCQDFKRAVTLIKKASLSGADAVKFQTYTPDTLTMDVNNKYFRITGTQWNAKTLYQLYKRAYTPWKWFKRLKRIADDLGIIFFSTAFDRTSVDLLEELNVPIHKVSSFELADLPLIEYIAKTNKPLMLSTGMARVSEIKEAVHAAKSAGANNLILLKCVSSYPAKAEDMNLKTIPDIKKTFNCPVGLSDHTLGIGVSVAAVSLGAKVIEKHFTLSRKDKSPDSPFSIEPGELKELVANIRIAEKALGRVYYGLTKEEKQNRRFKRSLFSAKDIKKGEKFTTENIKSIRPAYGLPPKDIKKILGKEAKRSLKRGTPLTRSLVNNAKTE